GSLRDAARAPGVREALRRAGADVSRLEFVALDLGRDEGWRVALRGCRYLQHVASPLAVRMPKDRDAMIRPALEGTRRAVAAALAAGVERIVLTSSTAAIMAGHERGHAEPFSEADWSRTDGAGISAYAESKTRAELEAWSLMEEAGRRDDLAVINPAVILGPLLDDDPGISALLVKRLLDGSVPAVAHLDLALVDVRDVAALQRNAMLSPRAGGRRHLAAAGSLDLVDLARGLRARFPGHAARIPRLVLPDWAVRLYARFDADLRDNLGALGPLRAIDNRQALALLGRPFTAPAEAAAATAASLIARRLV
ncbi:NAD-dependent epimerase/dehydratase family protein, partial [Devosia sp.]|uniref:NAD-dependent epimerase/dehydratase family protein n=1 Tax=Devosia sp. TaxID=1871048 RepID=UPI002F16DCED